MTSTATGIPRLIHQTWKDDHLPASLAPYSAAWKALHPGWSYVLWTDESTRTFVADYFPWFLPVYDGYANPIMRVDSARYLWMAQFGGIYADLDLEPLRAVDELVGSTEPSKLMLTREPATHCALYGRSLIVSNVFIASPPRHPAWSEVIWRLGERRHWPHPLEATGPFLLSDLYAESPRFRASVQLVDEAVMSPLDKFEAWAAEESEPQGGGRDAAGDAVAVHHWAGTWWRGKWRLDGES
jgi:mannosyltransferase OCH1-like enzyme